jgi:hypothetical protein
MSRDARLTPSSFRGARSASPESVTTIVSMDSGLRQVANPDVQLHIGE